MGISWFQQKESHVMRKYGMMGLLLCGWVAVPALAAASPAPAASHLQAASPMQPGLWSMHLSGITRVSYPPISTPMQRTMQVCVKAHQEPQTVFLQPGSGHCVGSHQQLSDGKTQWTFHCQAPGATVTQVGWFQSRAHHLDAHWTVTDHIHAGAQYTTVTGMQIIGTRLSEHCGNVK